MKFLIYALLSLLISPFTGNSQTVYDSYPKLKSSCRYIQRTMHLLESSTAEVQNEVRILVYGQSLSEQDWWKIIRDSLNAKYPFAKINMSNRSVGGFSSSILVKTVERDLIESYPDLVIFHVMGSDIAYEEIIKRMRGLTSTEIIIWNDPPSATSDWDKNMSVKILPELALKYQLGFMDIRTAMNQQVHELDVNYKEHFTIDGAHFNDNGNQLLAKAIFPYLNYNDQWDSDPFKLVSTLSVGEDVNWIEDTIIVDFEGNRVDIIMHEHLDTAAFEVLIDGLQPSEIQDCYTYSRPNEIKDEGWIWSRPAMVRIRKKSSWTNENFNLIIDSINHENTFFTFKVNSSESGFEGNGNNRTDFISKSGKIFIEANEVDDKDDGDWHVFRSIDVSKIDVKKGDRINWKTYPMVPDQFHLTNENSYNENSLVIYKSYQSGSHQLKLIRTSGMNNGITGFKIFKPYL